MYRDPRDAWKLAKSTEKKAAKERFNRSLVIGRSAEGTLLRKMDSLELITVPMVMPVGAFAWQENFQHRETGNLETVLTWCFTVDAATPASFRHHRFAFSQVPENFFARKGDKVRFLKIENVASLAALEGKQPHLYLMPRELVPADDLRHFETSYIWFVDSDQTPHDSRVIDVSNCLNEYPKYRPAITDKKVFTSTYALCSHRTQSLSTWDGLVQIEKNAKIEIGKWYVCQYNPLLAGKNKLPFACSIKSLPENAPNPVATFTQEYVDSNGKPATLVMCRDYVRIPAEVISSYGETELYTYHDLLGSVYFPLYCGFSSTVAIEVCFVRRQFAPHQDQNRFEVVAVNNGMGMYWLPKFLTPELETIIKKEEYQFIKTITGMESDYYSNFSHQQSYDDVMAERISQFKNFKEPENVQQALVFGDEPVPDIIDV